MKAYALTSAVNYILKGERNYEIQIDRERGGQLDRGDG